MNVYLRQLYRDLRRKFPFIFLISYVRIRYRNWHFGRHLGRTRIFPPYLNGPYSSIFIGHSGRKSQKWIQYLAPYDTIVNEVLNSFGAQVSILEIGIQNGGSIEIWRKIFGPKARIVGVDIDQGCAALELDAEIHIGNSSDENFLNSIQVFEKPFNFVIDDGSHDSKHQKKAFEFLFPRLSENGIYIVEDIEHSYYWSKHGGYLRRSSFINSTKRLIDQMHRQYFLFPSSSGFKVDARLIKSVTILPGMIIFRKGLPIESRIVETLSS